MPGGRPLKFETLESLTVKADEYFEVTKEDEWTITGLALALDTSRETLMDYEHKDMFSDAIKKYKLKVHNSYEKDLRKKARSGDIFALKNFGWRDERYVDQTLKAELEDKTTRIPKHIEDKMLEVYEEEMRKDILEKPTE